MTEPVEALWCYPRGIGNNWVPCFVCGTGGDGHPCQHDMAGFIDSAESGETIQQMFKELGSQCEIDLRRASEGRFQVKVGACKDHLVNLRLLMMMILLENKITEKHITYALGRD